MFKHLSINLGVIATCLTRKQKNKCVREEKFPSCRVGLGWGGEGVRRVKAVRVLGFSSGNRTFLRYPLLPPDSLEQRSQQTWWDYPPPPSSPLSLSLCHCILDSLSLVSSVPPKRNMSMCFKLRGWTFTHILPLFLIWIIFESFSGFLICSSFYFLLIQTENLNSV